MARLGLKLLVIVAVLAGALGVWSCNLFGCAFCSNVIERISGETAEAKVAAYVRSVARGDRRAALAVWEVPGWEGHDGWQASLGERRERVTDELIAAGIDSEFTILNVEWWGTCCEPSPIDDPRQAGGARLRVQLIRQDRSPSCYVFEVFVRDGAYWGAAAGYPPRHWALRDVYPEGQEPLFWRWVSEPSKRYLGWPPTPMQESQWGVDCG